MRRSRSSRTFGKELRIKSRRLAPPKRPEWATWRAHSLWRKIGAAKIYWLQSSLRCNVEETVMRLMKRGAITCSEEATVREVAQVMVVNRIGYCVVVNQKHEVVGIISPRSILKAFGMNLDS